MANARKKPAKSSHPRQLRRFADKSHPEDLRAHAIYLEARKKIVTPVLAFFAVLGGSWPLRNI